MMLNKTQSWVLEEGSKPTSTEDKSRQKILKRNVLHPCTFQIVKLFLSSTVNKIMYNHNFA